MDAYVYSCMLACFFTFAVCEYTHDKDKFKILKAIFATSPLIFIGAVRYNVGMDYPVYRSTFRMISLGQEIEDFEILYHKLNEVIAFLGGDFRWLFFITTLIFMVVVGLCILRDSSNPVMSVFLLVATTYYFCFLNGIRSMIAYAITMYALKYVEERKFIPFLIAILIASGFHVTASFFVVIYFIYNIKFDLKFTIWSTLIFLCASPLIGKMFNFFMAMTKYERYLKSDYADADQGFIKLAMIVLIIIFAAVFYDKEDKKFQLYYKLEVVSLWMSFLVPYVPLISRIRWMFGLPVIILLPMTINKIKDTWTRIIALYVIVILYIVYCYYNLTAYNTNAVLPYRTIFSVNFGG